jgi:uncharacterized membrane protein YoaK (UPF0700 family)
MFSHQGSERQFSHNAKLAIALSSIAGAINATGFMVVGTYTSHVTGQIAKFGDDFAQGQTQGAVQAILLVAFFLFGAMTAGAIVFAVRKLGRSRYALALLLEAAVLSAFVYFAMHHPSPEGRTWLWMTGMLSFAMGLQNALVTNVSGAVVRTTHLTGVVTDLGIEISRLAALFRRTLKAHGLREVMGIFGEHGFLHPEMHKAWLHFTIVASFLTGAVTGPLLFLKFGFLSMFAPVAGLLTLVIFDLAQGASLELKAIEQWLRSVEHNFTADFVRQGTLRAQSGANLLGCDVGFHFSRTTTPTQPPESPFAPAEQAQTVTGDLTADQEAVYLPVETRVNPKFRS